MVSEQEDRLGRLIEGNSEANRAWWALERKKEGRKVIGIVGSYVPEEVVYAAGMLPWRVTGTWRKNIVQAVAYRPERTCGFCSHVLESLLDGQFDFLDGVIIADQDQDLVRLWDVWQFLKKTRFCHIIHIPFKDSEIARQHLAKETRKLIKSLEEFGGVTITEESLRHSIEVYNRMRSLLAKLYELRKRKVPSLSGAEVLGITTTAMVMPKDQFNQELEKLFPHIDKRKVNLECVYPRLLVSSDMLDNPGYIRLIEENSLVAMDDLDTGSQYFMQAVDTSLGDPVYALAKRYLSRPGIPRMLCWDKQAEQVIKWVKEFDIDGVLDFPQTYCYIRLYRSSYFGRRLEGAGIPNVMFEREYYLADLGQLRTRIGAFVEMLAARV